MDKEFLTYNQQMRRLRNNKKIECKGSSDKQILVRSGYFNIINGYKLPFSSGTNADGEHCYIRGTTIEQMKYVKDFDEELKYFLLKYITKIEEEVRTLVGYKFDQYNNDGKTPWYSITAYREEADMNNLMQTISSVYSELSHSRLEYVEFYQKKHQNIPTWIMVKVIKFNTFIKFIGNCKTDVSHSICDLYSLYDRNNMPNTKLLIGSLHWMRAVRNSCAHNERIYCMTEKGNNSSRIIETYIPQLGRSYNRTTSKTIMDLVIYFKYYLPPNEYSEFILQLHSMLLDLSGKIHPNAFNNIRGNMGIKQLNDLYRLDSFYKNKIDYNKFDNK